MGTNVNWVRVYEDANKVDFQWLPIWIRLWFWRCQEGLDFFFVIADMDWTFGWQKVLTSQRSIF